MMRRTAGPILSIGAFLLSACAAPLWGQEVASAQISGFISDPSGAAVPMAIIIATQIDTGLIRKTVSGPTGTYVLPNLPVGSYNLVVQASGFETYIQKGIDLQVSNSIGINVTLHVGQLTEQVVVSATSNMVQTQSTSVSQVIDQRSITDLPLNGRQATQLIMLAGAATNNMPSFDVKSSKNYFSADAISVAGGQGNGTTYLMDGGANNDPFSSINLPFPFPDALQEFSVQTNSLSARYGLHPGAVVNVVTKSGGNAFHGDLFEFVRNGDFNAREFFAAAQDTLRRNQFGGTIGGRLRRDKLFGFFGYQATRIRTAPPTTLSFVPTQAVLAGDFSALESAACQSNEKARTIINPTTGQAFPNAFVPPSLFNQQALGFLKYVAVSSDPCGSIRYAIPQPQAESQYIGRVDWNQSAKNTVFGRYFIASYSSPSSFNNDLHNALLTTGPGANHRSQSAVVGDTYSLSPTAVNSVHATYNRLSIVRGPSSDMINPTDVGVNMTSGVPNFVNVSVSGYFSLGCGSSCAPSHFISNSRQVTDDFDWIRGRHHLSLGVNWIHNQLTVANSNLANGVFSFNGGFSSDGLLDFLLGLPNNFQQAGVRGGDHRQNYIGVYATDNVQINKRLNIDLGLRWEPYFPDHDTQQRGQAHFDAAAFAKGQKSTVYVNAPPGMFFVGDPGMPDAFSFNKVADFAPRVGLAWNPDSAGHQVVRAGFGVFYDSPMIFYHLDPA